MREILFRAKKESDGEWLNGYYCIYHNCPQLFADDYDWEIVDAKTVGQYTGLTDKNGTKIFEGDIVQYINNDDFDCQSVVKFGEYRQDGSSGEYSGRKCIGFYVKVDNFTCPDWCDDDPECFPYWLWQQNILEVANQCEVIGNIYDNLDILK